MTVPPSGATTPIDPAMISRALEVAGQLANDAADVIIATAGRAGRAGDPQAAGPLRSNGPSPFDWITDTDHTLARHTRRVLATEFPDIPLGSQEIPPSGAATRTGYRWVVDPVDGTANYLAGLPWCAYSLALVDSNGPVVGVIADPYRAQIYAAARGRGARANRTTLLVPQGAQFPGGLVCTEFTRSGLWPGMTAFVEQAARAGTGVRVLGCAALAVAQVPLGHAVAAVLHGYQEWDIAAAVALALESGARVMDRRGEPGGLPQDGLLVAAPGVAEEVHRWWVQALARR